MNICYILAKSYLEMGGGLTQGPLHKTNVALLHKIDGIKLLCQLWIQIHYNIYCGKTWLIYMVITRITMVNMVDHCVAICSIYNVIFELPKIHISRVVEPETLYLHFKQT